MPNDYPGWMHVLARLLPERAATELFLPAWHDLHLNHVTRRVSGESRRTALGVLFVVATLVLWLDCWRLALSNPTDLFARVPAASQHRPPERPMTFASDVRYAARALARQPLFSVFVIVTLALGIGANAAMFGVVDRLLVRGPEHVTDARHVERLYIRNPADGPQSRGFQTFGYASYDLLRRNARSFTAVAAYAINPSNTTFGEGSNAELLTLGSGTSDLFPLLGVHAAIGRFFSADEDNTAAPAHVVVLGDGLWRRAFGADRNVVGRTIKLGDVPHTVIGVAPRGFTGPELARVDVWVPMSLRSATVTSNWTTSWNAQWLRIVARLKPGVTPRQAGADATSVHRHGYTGDDKDFSTGELFVAPLLSDATGKEAAEVTVSRWLVGVAAVVLLVACSNVVNLLLARGARRRREIAVRVALGAARARLVRLLLTESVLLAAAGGAAGLAVAWVSGRLIRSVLLPNVDWTSSPVDGRVLTIAAIVTMTVGIIVGLVPALRASRPDLTQSLKSGSRQAGVAQAGLRSLLTVSQAALSIVLLVGAGLFVKSLWNVKSLDLGIEPDRALVVSLRWPSVAALDPPARQRERTRRTGEYVLALDRIRHLAGVAHASLAVGLPFQSSFSQYLRVTGRDSIPALPGGGPYVSAVTSDYFETIGTKILRGRGFTEADRAASEPVAVIDQTMARTLWPQRDPIGDCLYTGENKSVVAAPRVEARGEDRTDSVAVCARIVGVVGDARRFQLREKPAMHYYIPFGQERGFGGTTLLVRPVAATSPMVPTIRAVIDRTDPSISYVDVRLLQESIDPQIRPWRLGAMLFGFMGLLALVVAAVGLYSVVSYLIAQRTHEIGVRIALGARAGSILRLVMRHGMGMAATGVAIGTAIALIGSRSLAPLLFETSPRDPLVMTSVAAVMLLVALLASVVPANRARRVDPIEALRHE